MGTKPCNNGTLGACSAPTRACCGPQACSNNCGEAGSKPCNNGTLGACSVPTRGCCPGASRDCSNTCGMTGSQTCTSSFSWGACSVNDSSCCASGEKRCRDSGSTQCVPAEIIHPPQHLQASGCAGQSCSAGTARFPAPSCGSDVELEVTTDANNGCTIQGSINMNGQTTNKTFVASQRQYFRAGNVRAGTEIQVSINGSSNCPDLGSWTIWVKPWVKAP
jgi:hypothetical protein